MKKRGVSLSTIIITVVIMFVLLSTISISITYSVNNAKKLSFANEIYNIQNVVTEYIKNKGAIPGGRESITINVGEIEDFEEQFDGESIVDNSIVLTVLDFDELDIVNTNYGNKTIGEKDEEKLKDVYAVSEITGKVYYIAGFKSGKVTYYTLTDELKQMIEKEQNVTIAEKTITFTPSKIGWSNEGVSVTVFVPSEFESPSITINNANITYTSSQVEGGTSYIVNSAKINENYTITVNYTKNGISSSATYQTKIDNVAPAISKDEAVVNTATHIKGLNANDNDSGIKYFKYAEDVIETDDIKTYMDAYGKNVNKGSIKFEKKTIYTLYVEDNAGNYKVMYIDNSGNLVETIIPPPTLAARFSWWDSKLTYYMDVYKGIRFIDYMPTFSVGTIIDTWNAAEDKDGDGLNDPDIKCLAYRDNNNNIQIYIVGNGSGKIMANPDSSGAFGSFQSLTSVNNLGMLDTKNVTNMSNMFANATYVTNLDVSGFDTRKVTNMSGMFSGCQKLTSIDVSNFDTSKVTNMSGMFQQNNSLTSLDVSNFDTSRVTDMSSMFYCFGGTSIDVSNFDTSKVTNMYYMFTACSSITELDVSNFDTRNVPANNLSGFACMCDKLTTIIVGENFGQLNSLPEAGGSASYGYTGLFCYNGSAGTAYLPTTVIGANSAMKNYNWSADNRTVTFTN